MSYQQYLENFNKDHTDFRYTSEGPIALYEGLWYSVNGTPQNIVDVRYVLNEKDLKALGLSTGSEPRLGEDF
jgi:hypothetical protein